ncbi:hypothetical protein IA539_01230 [Gordonia sp. zg691]|uniref:hypothetical protein n=1 Tax=Gordonia jinghuaiqii TaxID=2758710 RepID=UPI00166221E0|nr:hypothetical protein [Gordonia jinghuaiqii]MBD0859841.1 hypothetical protein [Gordonia jinghuaiqii]
MSERALAGRLYSRLLRDPKFRQQTKGRAVVCLESDPAYEVAQVVFRNYGEDMTVVACFYPQRHAFKLAWLQGAEQPPESDDAVVMRTAQTTTVGMQLDYTTRGSDWTSNIIGQYPTAELEQELTTL